MLEKVRFLVVGLYITMVMPKLVNSMVKYVFVEVLYGRTNYARHSDVMFGSTAYDFKISMEISSSRILV